MPTCYEYYSTLYVGKYPFSCILQFSLWIFPPVHKSGMRHYAFLCRVSFVILTQSPDREVRQSVCTEWVRLKAVSQMN